MQLLLAVQEGEWEEVDLAIRAFQGMTAAIKFCPRPVVVAPSGMCLGGGAEICLHAARRQPHAELYMGLVETGVGLVPGGGGTKEMVFRAIDLVAEASDVNPVAAPVKFAQSGELLAAREPFYRQADVLLNTELRSVREVAQQIVHQFRLAESSRR